MENNMRWKILQKEDLTKWKRVFAWSPVETTENEIVWLEYVYMQQYYALTYPCLRKKYKLKIDKEND